MNRAMILPAAIAAGLHVAVLGYRSTPVGAAPGDDIPTPDSEPWIIAITPEDPPEPVIPESTDEPPEILPPGNPISSAAEIPVLESFAEFQMIRAPAPAVRIDGLDRIVPNWSQNTVGNGGDDAWRLMDHLDNVPRALFRTSPHRPSGTGVDRETVTVEFTVGTDGRVTSARVIDSTHSLLEDPCLRAVKRWKFEPGLRHNVPVPFRMMQTFVFKTRD